MRTRRLRLAASFALLATLAAPIAQAQDPNAPATKGARGGNGGGPGGGGPGGGGPGGGGPGGGGGFGGGGWGGPGGRGNQGPSMGSVERLVQIEAVQEDMKIDEKTKTKFKALAEQAGKKRAQYRENIPKMAVAAAAAANVAAAEAMAAQGITINPNANNNGGGRGGNNQMERQMMSQAMDALQVDVDAAFLRLLDKAQKVRVKQIALQQEGSRAFTNPDPEVVEKLVLTDEQLAEIGKVNGELRITQRQGMMELASSFMPADDTNGGGPANNGRRGFPNLNNLDPATRAKFDAAMQDFGTKNTATSMAAIGKLLTKGQKATYNKMIGEPFDLAKLRPAPTAPGGPGGPATAATKPATPPATDAAATKAATKAADAATPKAGARKSLRDSRNVD